MKVFILFPKASCYDRKDTETQRRLRTIFTEHLKRLVDTNTKIVYLLEDKIAYECIQRLGYTNVECVTAIPEYDFQYLLNNPDEDDPVEDYVLNLYPTTKCVAGDIGKKHTVDFKLLMTDKEQYYIKRRDCYKKRRREILDHLVASHYNVMLFRANSNIDRCADATTDVKQGDGRLVMQVDINFGNIVVYYGGIYIQEDMLSSILTL